MRVAALWARSLGLPVGPIVAVTNANRPLADWHRGGAYRPMPAVATLANAMDIGAPNNFERLGEVAGRTQLMAVERVDDAAIRERIRIEHARSGTILCPHSATAVEAYRRLDPAVRAERTWVAEATAHPVQVRRSGRAPDRRDPGAAAGAGGDPRPAVSGAVDPRDPGSAGRGARFLSGSERQGRLISRIQAPLVTAPCEADPTSRAYLA